MSSEQVPLSTGATLHITASSMPTFLADYSRDHFGEALTRYARSWVSPDASTGFLYIQGPVPPEIVPSSLRKGVVPPGAALSERRRAAIATGLYFEISGTT